LKPERPNKIDDQLLRWIECYGPRRIVEIYVYYLIRFFLYNNNNENDQNDNDNKLNRTEEIKAFITEKLLEINDIKEQIIICDDVIIFMNDYLKKCHHNNYISIIYNYKKEKRRR